MRLPILALMLAALTLTSCGRIRESRILNPFNWFGRSQESQTVVAEDPNRIADGRQLVAQVTELEIARQPGGAIIRASGLPPTQGWWNTELVADNDGEPVDGVLTYRFVIAEPIGPKRVSTPQSRELTAAKYLSDIKLAEIRQIVVLGVQNSRSVRR
ncbi:MAG: hypothetical protein OEY05_11385 [Paracoccaceae bacterium]|nr:hypothetical protein [Paracoccaceae bacterium]MDH5530630.1 hypothetical protein [Paracoccaceae bacterium]